MACYVSVYILKHDLYQSSLLAPVFELGTPGN